MNNGVLKDAISIFGTVASIYGIILTLYQLYHLTSQTKAIKKELDKKSEETNRLLSYGALESQEHMLRSLTIYLGAEQYAIIESQLQDVKKTLLQISDEPTLKFIVEGKHLIQEIGMDIVSVNEKWRMGRELNESVLLKHNGEIITILQQASNILKQQGI